MWILSCVWLAGGALVGALGHLAALAPRVWWRSRRASWWGLLAVGALAALGSGWLGTLVFGRFFASSAAACGAVLAVALVPYGVRWLGRRTGASAQRARVSSS
jgi:hypothetical protein